MTLSLCAYVIIFNTIKPATVSVANKPNLTNTTAAVLRLKLPWIQRRKRIPNPFIDTNQRRRPEQPVPLRQRRSGICSDGVHVNDGHSHEHFSALFASVIAPHRNLRTDIKFNIVRYFQLVAQGDFNGIFNNLSTNFQIKTISFDRKTVKIIKDTNRF